MSDGQFADAIHLDRGLMSKVFSGKRPMGLNHAFRAALMTGLPVEDLVTGGEAQKLLKLYVDRLKASSEIAKDSLNVA